MVYKALGRWVRECYGTPLASSSGAGNEFTVLVRAGDTFDRFQLTEDIVMGQRVRNYTITAGGQTYTGSPQTHRFLPGVSPPITHRCCQTDWSRRTRSARRRYTC